MKLWRTGDAAPLQKLQRLRRSGLGSRGLDVVQVWLVRQAMTGRRDKRLTNDQQVTAVTWSTPESSNGLARAA